MNRYLLKILSEMEVAPCCTLFTVSTVYIVYTGYTVYTQTVMTTRAHAVLINIDRLS